MVFPSHFTPKASPAPVSRKSLMTFQAAVQPEHGLALALEGGIPHAYFEAGIVEKQARSVAREEGLPHVEPARGGIAVGPQLGRGFGAIGIELPGQSGTRLVGSPAGRSPHGTSGRPHPAE